MSIYTINISKGDSQVRVNWDDLDANVQEYIITYGLTQSLNDVHSQIKATDDNAPALAMALVEKRLANFYDGVVPTGGGGKALSPMEKAIREVVENFLRKNGMKAPDAKKAAKFPQAAMRDAIERALRTAKPDLTGQDLDSAIDLAFDKNWGSVEKQAEIIVKNTQIGLDLDL